MEKKTATQVEQQADAKAHMVAAYVAQIMVDINQKTPLSYEQANSIAQVLASPIKVLIDKIDQQKLKPTTEMTPDDIVVGNKVLAWGGYFFEAEWDGDNWCSIGGDDFDFFMPLPNNPGQKEQTND